MPNRTLVIQSSVIQYFGVVVLVRLNLCCLIFENRAVFIADNKGGRNELRSGGLSGDSSAIVFGLLKILAD